jgi:hypothetical protein
MTAFTMLPRFGPLQDSPLSNALARYSDDYVPALALTPLEFIYNQPHIPLFFFMFKILPPSKPLFSF